jgi:drug/metabolite transporter (DMT)-like permease
MPTNLLIVAVTLNAVVGQLLLKHALTLLGGRAATADFWKFILAAARSPWIYSSIAVQGFGYILWMLVLTRAKLGVATASTGAGFYLLSAFAAWAIYGESLNSLQWAGICFVTIGVICVSLAPG